MQIIDDISAAMQSQGISGLDLVLAVAIVLIALPISRAADHMVRRAVDRVPNVSAEISHDLGRLARYGVLVVSWSMALSVMGFDVGWLVAIVVIAVVMIVLMMRPLVENSAAGLLLQARPSFGIGDQLEVGGYQGEVVEISARTTALKTADGIRVHIPNTQVLGTTLVVYTAYRKRRVSIDLGVDPSEDLDAVSQTLIDAVAGVDTVLADPAPAVLARSFGNGVINLSVRFWFGPDTHSETKVTDMAVRALQRAITDEGINCPPPQLFVETSTSGPGGLRPAGGNATDPAAARSD